jgi:excisionase family DNA binding protein
MSSKSTDQLMPLAASVEDSCRILGIGKTKLYEEIAAGRLKARKIGKKTLLPTEQFPAWLQSLKPIEAKAAG